MPEDAPTIRSLTPTLCALFGVEPPALSSAPPLGEVTEAARRLLGGRRVRRCLVHAADAIGHQLTDRLPRLVEPVARAAPIRVRLRSVSPSMTPVCYASMFTGAAPAAHGIRTYEKPVLGCDTLFDAFARAGLRVAIVAVSGSSIDSIFRGRDLDYWSEKYDPWVTERVVSLMGEDRHDLIVAYHQEYDDVMHGTDPWHPRAVRGAENVLFAFSELAREMDRRWASHDRLIVFAPDHGAHPDPANGKGTHGSESPFDMELSHYYGLSAGSTIPGR